MAENQIIYDREYSLQLKGNQVMLLLNLLSELKYSVAKPIIEDIEMQLKSQIEVNSGNNQP